MAVRGLLSSSRYMRPWYGSVCALRPVNTTSQVKNELQPQPSSFPGITSLLKEKTGETGKHIVGIGLVATLYSKEILVFHAETLVGISVFGVIFLLMRRVGGQLREFFDNRAQGILDEMNAAKNATITQLTDEIAAANNLEKELSIRDDLYEILREEALMKREEIYRVQLSDIRKEVMRRLEYQLQLENLEKEYEKKHLVSWLQENVYQSLTSKQDDNIAQCIGSLKKLTAA